MSNQLPIVIGSHAAESGKKRVAAYCRVSSPSAEQLKSYQAQVDNYRKKFEKDDSVVFVGVYGDPGASGTRAANREGFMRMIDDCRRGEIDAIWTKSVSRFGRNTVDTLVYTRELRNLGIDVYFEKENIHSREPAGEMLLTLMAAFAESESFNMSENVKWGKHRRYEKGLVESISINNMLGLRQSNGVITVIEEEAEIVRRIFREYLEGYNMHEIAARLVNDGVRSRTDLPKWSATVIKHILTNEKFAGDCLLQKTYIADPIAHHSVPNWGEYAQFFVEDCYPTIVGKEEWLVVQEMMKRASNVTRPSSEEYPFVGKMYCSVCGQYTLMEVTHIRKLKKYKPTPFKAKGSYYDKDAADYAVMFIESLCHTKGTWAGKPFELIDWQEQIIRDIFGTMKPNGYRQFNTAYLQSDQMLRCVQERLPFRGKASHLMTEPCVNNQPS